MLHDISLSHYANISSQIYTKDVYVVTSVGNVTWIVDPEDPKSDTHTITMSSIGVSKVTLNIPKDVLPLSHQYYDVVSYQLGASGNYNMVDLIRINYRHESDPIQCIDIPVIDSNNFTPSLLFLAGLAREQKVSLYENMG